MSKKICTWCNKEITTDQNCVELVSICKGDKKLFHDTCENELWQWLREHRDESL